MAGLFDSKKKIEQPKEIKSKTPKTDVRKKFVFSVALIKLAVLVGGGIALYFAFKYYF